MAGIQVATSVQSIAPGTRGVQTETAAKVMPPKSPRVQPSSQQGVPTTFRGARVAIGRRVDRNA